jgi:hypothetical protein
MFGTAIGRSHERWPVPRGRSLRNGLLTDLDGINREIEVESRIQAFCNYEDLIDTSVFMYARLEF